MRVLSLFDGCGMARQALKNIGASVESYIAYEIDKYASAVCRYNHPDVKHYGDVLTFPLYAPDQQEYLKDTSLVIGGSPCQDLSPLKNQGQGLQGIKSKLFWRYVEFVRVVKPTYFVLENVGRMKKADSDIISKELGVEPIRINSSLFSAQNRDRLYWTNIKVPSLLLTGKDLGIHDILLPCNHKDLSTTKFFLTTEYVKFLSEDTKWNWKFEPYARNRNADGSSLKAKCLTANYYKMARSDNYIREGDPILNADISGIRKLHPIECERLQTLPDNYTQKGMYQNGNMFNLSNTQRYKMIGNGFTVAVIEHILKGMK